MAIGGPLAQPMPDWLRKHLPADAEADAPLLRNPRTGKRWSHWALWDAWKRAAKRAGVDAGLYEGTKHSFATDALARTGNQRAIQKYLGHSDPRSTDRYAQLTDRSLLDVVGVRTVQ